MIFCDIFTSFKERHWTTGECLLAIDPFVFLGYGPFAKVFCDLFVPVALPYDNWTVNNFLVFLLLIFQN